MIGTLQDDDEWEFRPITPEELQRLLREGYSTHEITFTAHSEPCEIVVETPEDEEPPES